MNKYFQIFFEGPGRFLAFFSLISFHIYLCLPIEHVPDYKSMLHAAKYLEYNDNWPPLTLLLMHYLNMVTPSGELMLLLNLAFLWGACLIGMKLFYPKKIAYWFMVIPFIPQLLLYENQILKDNIISFGYMFISMVLFYFNKTNKTPKIWQVCILIFSVFYFTMAKIQANFIFPFMLMWIIWLLPRFSSHEWINITYQSTVLLISSYLFFMSIVATNTYFIKDEHNLNKWQCVKIYDLAGMSVFSNKMYVPEFLLKTSSITVLDIEKSYEYLWEPLIVYPHSPLRLTKSDREREQLVQVWKESILKDPIAYVKHRGRLWLKIMTGSTVKGAFLERMKDHPTALKIAPFLSIFSFMPLFPIFLYFWWLSIRNLKKDKHALPLFILSSMGLTLIFVLTIFSLAAAARYIYFSWCCFIFAVPFAYEVWRQKRRNNDFEYNLNQ